MKRVLAKTKVKVKARKHGVRYYVPSKLRSHRSRTLLEDKDLLSEVIRENHEAFKLLAQY